MYGVKSRSAMIKHDEKPFSFQQSNIDKHIKNKLILGMYRDSWMLMLQKQQVFS